MPEQSSRYVTEMARVRRVIGRTAGAIRVVARRRDATLTFLLGFAVYFAVRRRFDRHKAVTRWALPIWLYVSVTGVVIYWMLYRMGF